MTSDREKSGTGALMGALVLFLVVGAPLAAYVWHTLSEVLSGRVDGGRVAVALILLGIFLGVLRGLTAYLSRLEAGS